MRRGIGMGLVGAATMLWLGIASRHGTAAGTQGVTHLPSFAPENTAILQVTSTATPQLSTPDSVAFSQRLQHLLHQAGAVLFWLLAIAAVVAVLVFAVRVWQRVHVDDLDQAEGEVAEPQVDIGALDAASAASIDDLRAGADVGGAIVACWRRLEDLAAASGAPRESWQDTSEYVVEVLGHTPAPASDLRRLAELYRSACYAPTRPQETERDAAIACLDSIRRALAEAGR